MSLFSNIFLMICTSLGFSTALAATVYVRSGASGLNNGSDWANAYSSLPATLVRGNVYYMADGNYSGRVFNTVSNGQVITIKKATLEDHGTDTGWQASYGDGQVAFTSGLEFTTSDWVLDGQTGGGAVNAWAGNFGMKITEVRDGSAIIRIGYDTTANNITIKHVDMQGKGSVSTQGGSYSNDALGIYGDSNITLSYFRMRGVGRCPFFISPKNLVVEHGWVEKFYGSSGVHSEVASIWGFAGSVGDVTFRHNLFTDIQSTGGLMWDNSSDTSAKLLVYGNIFYRPPGATWGQANGVIGGWTAGGSEFHNAKVYNNTFINVDQESLSTFPQVYSNNEAYNNIFYNSDSPNFAKFSAHDHNYFVNSGGTQGEPNGQSLSTTSSIFVNMGTLDFRLLAATAAGRSLLAPFNVDALNQVRGSDGRFDRGAMEFGGTTSPSPSPAPAPAPAPAPMPAPAPSPVSGISLLSSLAPTSLNNSDGSSVNYELGMRFMASKAGTIQAIRFFKSSSESGTHTGKIYSASGSVLASVVFSSESGSGWQVQRLSSPLRINANTEYVVSVNTGNSYYVASNNGFASQIKNGSLMSATGSAGVYGPVGRKPSSSWQNSNYFRDVVFLEDVAVAPAPVATEVTVDNLAAGAQNAQVSFTGQWCTSTVAGSFGTTSLYSCGASTNTYTYKANLTASGQYDVYVRHSARDSRSASVAISVSTTSGQVVKNINQQINGATWVLHGRYSMSAGANSISISHLNSGGDASVDGVRIVPVP